MASHKKKLGWYEWKSITRKIYLSGWKGWPEAEMRKYHKMNMSPIEAYMAALQKRVQRSNDA